MIVEKPFRVFGVASQTINYSWRKSKQKVTNFMIIKTTCPNLLHDSDFLCFFFMKMSLKKNFQVCFDFLFPVWLVRKCLIFREQFFFAEKKKKRIGGNHAFFRDN